MKKITVSIAIIIAVIIGCKTNISNGVTSKLNVTFEPKSNSNVKGAGVFTEKKNLSDEEMFIFFSNILKILFKKVNIGIAFNVMCPIVDFKRDDLFYLSYDKLGTFLKNELSRHYVINNNYGLWEYTTFVYK